MNKEEQIVQLMIEKALDKLNTAIFNLKNGQYDDAASRSYYAVFHAISAVLYSKGLSFSSHSQVIGAFNKMFIKENLFPKDYSQKIHSLFDARQTGDYDIESDIDESDALETIEFATELIEKVKDYLDKK